MFRYCIVLFCSSVSANFWSHPNWYLLNDETCGLHDPAPGRIVGGMDAALGHYPWIARLGYMYNQRANISDVSFECGGSLINHNYLISAAHCMISNDSTRYLYHMQLIRLGEHDVSTNPDCRRGVCADPIRDYYPEQVICHKDFNQANVKNDVALIRLQKPVVFTRWIKPICLCHHLFGKTDYSPIVDIAGWGDLDAYKTSATTLQTVKISLVDLYLCQTKFNVDVSDGQLCAGSEIGRDSCQGDSGGPMMKQYSDNKDRQRYFLLGLVSTGDICGQIPAIYADVDYYMNWILNRIEP